MDANDYINDNLSNLKNFAPNLSKIDKQNCFIIPLNYFEGLSENIEESVLINYPVLSKIEKKNAFEVPQGYFEQLTETIHESVSMNESALYSLEKENPFAVPNDYFDELPLLIQGRIISEKQKPSVIEWLLANIFTPRLAYVSIVVIVLAIGGSLLWKNNISSTESTLVDASVNLVVEEVQNIDESALTDELINSNVSLDVEDKGNNKEQIINYLMENNIEVSSIINEL